MNVSKKSVSLTIQALQIGTNRLHFTDSFLPSS